MDIRAFGKGFQEFYYRSEHEYGVRYIKGKVGRVDYIQASNELELRYENVDEGLVGKERFDMVVLAVGAEAPKMNGGFPIPLKTEDDGFVSVQNAHLDPVATSVDGIFVAGLLEGPKDIPDSVVQAGAAAMRASIVARSD
jgi:heterodisulfide reductase subunit A